MTFKHYLFFLDRFHSRTTEIHSDAPLLRDQRKPARNLYDEMCEYAFNVYVGDHNAIVD